MRWTLVKNQMKEVDYCVKEMDEMEYGLKEVKMKCD